MYFFLKDSPVNEWLKDAFNERNFDINFLYLNNQSQYLQSSRIIRIFRLHIGYLMLSIKSLYRSNNNDVIISLLDVLALYVFLISRLLFIHRKIVVINIMINNNNDLLTRIKKCLFKIMLKGKNVYPTVTSLDLSVYYKDFLNIPDKKFYLLHDCYGKLGKYKMDYIEGEGYVFCGGTNGRDWITLIKIAELIPNVKFVVVGPKKNTLGDQYPSNIKYYYDIKFDEFQHLLNKCSIVAIPIKTQAPAGLIVLFTAGLMSKPVVTTENVTIKEYIINGENGYLIKMGDYLDFAEKISSLLENPQTQRQFGEKLKSQIEIVGSPHSFAAQVNNITNQIDENSTDK